MKIDVTQDIASSRWSDWTFPQEKGAPIKKRILQHQDGVYIGLKELEYLNDWALSYTAYKTLLSSPPDWHWGSVFNLIEENGVKDEESPAMRFGSALHTALLESLQHYDTRFKVSPSAKTHPKALRTVDDIKDAIKGKGVTPRGTRKSDLIDQLLSLDPKAQILDVIRDGFFKANPGVTEMTEEEDAKIRLMHRLAQLHPDLQQAFSGVGLSEVSVFWTDVNGTRQRVRLDRVKPAASIDLKSFSNWQGRDFHKALLREAALRMYDLQAGHYDIGRQEARRLVQEGKVFLCFEERVEEVDGVRWAVAYDADGEILRERELKKDEAPTSLIVPAPEEVMETARAVFLPDTWDWVWIFYKTDGAPTAQPVRLTRESKAFQRGVEFRDRALTAFTYYRERFGLEQMWVRLEPIWTPDDEEWPFFMSADV